MKKKQLPAITVSTVTCEPFHASSKLTQNQTFVVRFTRGLVNSQRLSFSTPVVGCAQATSSFACLLGLV